MSTKFSYSKMSTYEQCGFKYKLIYVDKHYSSAGSVALDIGLLIHSTEENIAISIRDNKPIDYVALKNNIIVQSYKIEHKYYKEFNELDKSGRTYRDKLYYYLDKGIYDLEQFMKNHNSYKIVGIEQKFNVKYSEAYIFHGAIDRVFYDTATDTYIIQDIKTWNVPADSKELVTPLQFVYYTLAACDLYKCKPEQVICQYYLPFCDLTQSAGTPGYLARGLKKIDKLLSNIEDKNFTPKPSPLCHWCNFCPTNPNQPDDCKHLCPYFCKWTKEHKTFAKNAEWQGLEKHPQVLEQSLQQKGGE